jgi:hypothetical protein
VYLIRVSCAPRRHRLQGRTRTGTWKTWSGSCGLQGEFQVTGVRYFSA